MVESPPPVSASSPRSADAAHTGPMPDLRAVVTDLDGVLTDTETVFFHAVDVLLAEVGAAPLHREESRGLVGLDNASIWRALQGHRKMRLSLEDYTRRVDALARTFFERELVPAPGAVEFLEDVRSRGVPLALATSAEEEWVEHRLGLLGLTGVFDVVVTGDQVRKPKPDPEIYLAATAALGVPPAETLGLEDSPSGIRASRAAGLYTIAVRTVWVSDTDQTEAHRTVGSLGEIDLDSLGITPRRRG